MFSQSEQTRCICCRGRLLRLLVALVIANPLLFKPVLADDRAADAADALANSKGNLILGVAWIPDYIGSDDYQPVPMIISNFYLAGYKGIFEGTGGRLDVWDHPYL